MWAIRRFCLELIYTDTLSEPNRCAFKNNIKQHLLLVCVKHLPCYLIDFFNLALFPDMEAKAGVSEVSSHRLHS